MYGLYLDSKQEQSINLFLRMRLQPRNEVSTAYLKLYFSGKVTVRGGCKFWVLFFREDFQLIQTFECKQMWPSYGRRLVKVSQPAGPGMHTNGRRGSRGGMKEKTCRTTELLWLVLSGCEGNAMLAEFVGGWVKVGSMQFLPKCISS